jgi:hypothetical protein
MASVRSSRSNGKVIVEGNSGMTDVAVSVASSIIVVLLVVSITTAMCSSVSIPVALTQKRSMLGEPIK